jgi:hypothetical protein
VRPHRQAITGHRAVAGAGLAEQPAPGLADPQPRPKRYVRSVDRFRQRKCRSANRKISGCSIAIAPVSHREIVTCDTFRSFANST